LGAVEGDEVGEAVDDAAVAHEVAVEGEDAGEALLAEAEEPDESELAEETPIVNDAAIEGEPVAEALAPDGVEPEDTESPEQADGPRAVEADEDEDDDAASVPAPQAEPEQPVWTPSERTPIRATVAPLIAEAGGRAREWLRRRRNR
jgi:hypothetical protein